MKVEYKSKSLSKICTNISAARKHYGKNMAEKIHLRIDQISAADTMLENKTYIAIPPGATIKEQMEYHCLSLVELSERMGRTEQYVSDLLAGRVEVTSDVAERLESIFCVPAKFWNKLEVIYREKLSKITNESNFNKPYSEYQNCNMSEWTMVPNIV